MAAIGWYGPLINLSKASSHIGDYVQLLVFVHRSTPIQYKLSKCEVVRTDIQVGDDTRPFFSVSIWQKKMGSLASAGDVILLQNPYIIGGYHAFLDVRITRFGDFVGARTVDRSSVQCLVHPYELLVSKGADDLIGECRVGITTKEKLRKVIEWVQRAGSTLHNVELHSYQQRRQLSMNWKVYEERKSQDVSSLIEVMHLTDSCKVTFYASVGEIFLQFTRKHLHEFEEEKMFISRRLSIMGENNLAEDLICTGCQLCGSPLDSKFGSTFEETTIPLYCQKSSNRLHAVSLIYRPFMLYVWDDSKYIPLLVTNKAAELLFGNISAERVYSCYQGQKHGQNPDSENVRKENCSDARAIKPNAAEGGISCSCSLGAHKQEKYQCDKSPNFYLIWLIFLKMLLQQGNSPLKFEVTVNAGKDWESGRCEMVSMSMPCFRTKASSV